MLAVVPLGFVVFIDELIYPNVLLPLADWLTHIVVALFAGPHLARVLFWFALGALILGCSLDLFLS